MFETVVWATDGSAAADRAVPFARALVERAQGKLVVVHVREPIASRAGAYPVFAEEDEAKVRQQVEELRREGVEVRLDLITAAELQPARAIADRAAAAGAHAIVIGTRGHRPVAGLLLGSVAQRLLHIAPCAVLAVPDRPTLIEAEREPAPVAAVH